MLLSVLAVITALVAPQGGVLAAEHRAARGWLQLERDQQTYRERVEPLDLREQRALEAVERQQRLELRAADQRLDRAERLGDRLPARRSPTVVDADRAAARRRTVQRQRTRVQSQQQGLPFGRGPRR